MKIIRYRTFKRHLEFFLNNVGVDHTPVVVIMENGRNIVVLSKNDYEVMQCVINPSRANNDFLKRN